MIQNGDRFGYREIISSMDELRNADILAHIDDRPGSGDDIVLSRVGYFPDSVTDLLSITPGMYAKMCMTGQEKLSSALSIDMQLRDKGIKTTYRFSHNYTLPGLSHRQLVRDAYTLEYYMRLLQVGFSAKPGDKHREEIHNILDGAARMAYYYNQYIWVFNRDAVFDYPNRFEMYRHWKYTLAYILGVGYRFHPKDVYEFLTNNAGDATTDNQCAARRQHQRDFHNWCKENYDIDTGCMIFHPSHMEKLKKILTGNDTSIIIQRAQMAIRNAWRTITK